MSNSLARMSVSGELPAAIQRVVDTDLPETLVRTALAQSWPIAYRDGGIEAIAGALLLCRRYGLDPLSNHVYVAKFSSGYQAFPSAYGMLAIANQRDDFDGMVVEREWVENSVAHCVIKAYRKDRRHPSEGHGYKPAGNDKHAQRKAKTMAIRHALTELYAGVLPWVNEEQGRFVDEDGTVVPSLADIEEHSVRESVEPESVSVLEDEIPASPEPDMATRAQLNHLFALAGERKWNDTQRKDQASLQLGRMVESFNDLTKDEASQIIEAWLQAPPEPAGSTEVEESVPLDDEASPAGTDEERRAAAIERIKIASGFDKDEVSRAIRTACLNTNASLRTWKEELSLDTLELLARSVEHVMSK
ncbi:MAG: recombinase RecT [Actinomycetota bacterium]